MKPRFVLSLLPFIGVIPVIAGCGGGGGGGNGGTVGKGTAPTAATKTDVSDIVAGFGQSIATISFEGYGPKLLNHQQVFFDDDLGLYAYATVGPDFQKEFYFVDQAKTQPAGNYSYMVHDDTFTLNGPMSVTAGRFSGLTGQYNQVSVFNSSNQIIGYSGSCNYSVPNTSAVDSQFTLSIGSSGGVSGTATLGTALQNGYSQTQKVTYNLDGSFSATSTDTNSIKTSLSFNVDSSGTGSITGSSPGLPATIFWGSSGTGQVKYADGSIGTITTWALQ